MLVGTRVHNPTVHNFRGYTINRASRNYSCLHSFQTKPPFTHLQPPTLLTFMELRHSRGSPSGTVRSKGKDRGFPRRQDMDLFNLIRAPNPTKVKTGTRPRAAHEVPLLTVTASRVIEMEDPAAATDSSGVPSTIERSPLDFANENLLNNRLGVTEQKTKARKHWLLRFLP
nr:hypothetical protein [Tanacetum cinerariifolium]